MTDAPAVLEYLAVLPEKEAETRRVHAVLRLMALLESWTTRGLTTRDVIQSPVFFATSTARTRNWIVPVEDTVRFVVGVVRVEDTVSQVAPPSTVFWSS